MFQRFLTRFTFRTTIAVATVACLVPAGDTVERESKILFPGIIQPDDSSEEHYLMGTALRKVTIFGIHAYAAGVYFAKSSLRNIKDCNSLLQKNSPYLIRIVPARDSSLSHIKSALGRSLEKRLLGVSEVEQQQFHHEIQQFLGAFPNVKIKMGESLLMWRSVDGDVFVMRPDHEAVKISGKFLGNALLSVYLDESTAIPQMWRILYVDLGLNKEKFVSICRLGSKELVLRINLI